MVILVTGATGFVGRAVVGALDRVDADVRCLVRLPGHERVLSSFKADIHYGSVADSAALRAAFHSVDVMVHLVAVIRQKGNATFDNVNRMGTENVVAAAREAGVGRFLYISAIGAAEGPQLPYLHSKWQAEQAVINSGLPYTILRPSLLFGPGDEFINTLACLVRSAPIIPVPGSGRTLYQPLAVMDLARCISDTLFRDDLLGQTIEIGGPQHLSYNEMVDTVARTCGLRRWKAHLPVFAMKAAVRLLEALTPRPPATSEQLKMISIPNIADVSAVKETFVFEPMPLEGNIDFVKQIGLRDAIRGAAGFMPSSIRDH